MAFLVVPATLLTQLQAVNLLISTLGEGEVESIDASSESLQALSRLNEADLEGQSIGWNWNREYAYPLTLNADGTVNVPDQTLRVTMAYAQSPNAGIINVVQRGQQLYDPVNHTSVFTVAPKVDLIVRLEWDSTPQVFRQYVAYKAAERFHARLQGESVVLQVNAQDIRDARQLLDQYEDENASWNAVNGNSGVLSAIYGVGGLRRNRAGN